MEHFQRQPYLLFLLNRVLAKDFHPNDVDYLLTNFHALVSNSQSRPDDKPDDSQYFQGYSNEG